VILTRLSAIQQEINQEDLAAILPDISTAEGPNEDVAGPPFDGFEDVTNLANKAEISAAATSTASAAAPTSAAAQEAAEEESSSEDNDMLPETVVSEAIQRIDVDDDNTCKYTIYNIYNNNIYNSYFFILKYTFQNIILILCYFYLKVKTII